MSAVLTRARAKLGGAMPYYLLDPLDRPGRCGGSRPQDSMVRSAALSFFLVDCCSPVRGGDGARTVGAIDDDDDVGLAGSGPPRIRRRASAAR
jgi:hypothetical protein